MPVVAVAGRVSPEAAAALSDYLRGSMINPFVLVNSAHGAMIVSHLDYKAVEGGMIGVGAQIIHRGAYEPQEVATIKSLLELRRQHFGDGVVMVDCGANIGVHTLEAANLMRGWGEVFAIEPQERIFYALGGNIALQNCFNARAIWAAAGTGIGSMPLSEPDYRLPGSYGSLELRSTRNNEDIGQPIDRDRPTGTVPVITIDSLRLPRLDLLKIDVEGMELEVLEGARETVMRCKPILIVEHIKLESHELPAVLKRLGYEGVAAGMNTLAFPKDAAYVRTVEENRDAEFNAAAQAAEHGDTFGSLARFDSLVGKYPDYQPARLNRGIVRMQAMQLEGAIEDFEYLLSTGCAENTALVKFSRGFANLVLGNLKQGFVDFEYRKVRGDLGPPKPGWDGRSSLKGKIVHVVGEMGYGDNLMFSRYIPMLQERGAKVILSIPPTMQSLMACIPGLGDIITVDELPECDHRIRMMSLAHIFGTDIDTVPAPTALKLPTLMSRKWGAGLSKSKLNVGLCWCGSRESFYDKHRTIPLDALSQLFEIAGIDFYSLVLDVRKTDVEAFDRLPVVDVGTQVASFLDTACLVSKLDLVITCDTSVAHLAGTLGVPTWVMLTSFRTYWLWIRGREDNPWYPSARCFRQDIDGEWGSVVARVKRDLMEMRPEMMAATG
jgi:FkbM family methyltransferase